jgi:addiction module HigA family antidote
VIATFADAATEDVWDGQETKAARTAPKVIWPVVRRTQSRDAARHAPRAPPGNEFKLLKGAWAGWYQIRVNDQYRIRFTFREEHCYDVAAKTSTTTNVRPRLPTHRPPTHPGGDATRRVPEAVEHPQVEAAARIGVPFQRMNALVKERRGVTADTALRLAALTGTDTGFWMGLQADYDLWHALRDVDLLGIKPIAKAS